MKISNLLALPFLVFMSAATMADVTKIPADKSGGVAGIFISGKITNQDYEAFKKIAVGTDYAVVYFSSPGGLVKPAIDIGKAIRIKGYATAVYDTSCASACALAWLSGEPRMMSKGAAVGFHGAYLENDDGTKVSASVGNALVGSYLGSLGFTDRVVSFVTAEAPEKIEWLNKTKAERLGLPVVYLDNKRELITLYNRGVVARWSKPADLSKARYYYYIAAQGGFAGAQNNLGDMYETGEGVPVDVAASVYWYTRAAERGEPTAYLSLASALGPSAKDAETLIEALKFAYLAEAYLQDGKNKANARKLIDEIENRLSKKGIEFALELAESWEPLYQEKYLQSDSSAK